MILSPRHLPRLASTVGLFTRYGLADFAGQQGLQGLAHEPEPGDDFGGSPQKAEAFRKRLVELGPAYIEQLEQLEQLEDLIEQELGGRLSKMFGSFDREPLGTASLGQVHAAGLRDGRPVVVKVQPARHRGVHHRARADHGAGAGHQDRRRLAAHAPGARLSAGGGRPRSRVPQADHDRRPLSR